MQLWRYQNRMMTFYKIVFLKVAQKFRLFVFILSFCKWQTRRLATRTLSGRGEQKSDVGVSFLCSFRVHLH